MKPRRSLFGACLFMMTILWPSGSLFARAWKELVPNTDTKDGYIDRGGGDYLTTVMDGAGTYIEIGTNGGTQTECDQLEEYDYDKGPYPPDGGSPCHDGTVPPEAISPYGFGSKAAYVEWPLTTIPDSAHIYTVQFKYLSVAADPGKQVKVTQLAVNQPSALAYSNAAALISQIFSGGVYIGNLTMDPPASYTVGLGDVARDEVEAKLTSGDWFAVGLATASVDPDTGQNRMNNTGQGFQSDWPTLRIEYASATVAPTLSGSAASTSQINWTWNDPNQGFGDDIANELHDHVSHAVIAEGADLTSFNETGLAVNTQYTRHVRAWNDAGSIESTSRSVYTRAAQPTSGNIASITAFSATLGWTANGNPNGTNYILEASTWSDFRYITDSSTVTDSGSHQGDISDGLQPNRLTYFRGRAKNGDGIQTANWTPATVSSYTAATVPGPSQISNIYNVFSDSCNVRWAHAAVGVAKNPVGTRYVVEISTWNDFRSIEVSLTTAPQSSPEPICTVNGLVAGKTNYFRVRALNENSIPTVNLDLGNNDPPPAEPQNAKVNTITTTSATIEWGQAGNTDMTYLVQVTTDPDGNFASWTPLTATVTTSNPPPGVDLATHTFTGLLANTSQYFRVRAKAASGAVSPWHNFDIGFPTMTWAAAPTNGLVFSTMVFVSSASVRWDTNGNPANRTSYYLEVFDDQGLTSLVADATLAPSISPASHTFFSGLTPNTSHYFRVRAIHARTGGYTAEETAFTNEPAVTWARQPDTASWTGDTTESVSFNWNILDNPLDTRYIIEVARNNSFSTGLQGSTVTANSDPEDATFNGLLPNTSYYARVRAVNRKNVQTANLNVAAGAARVTNVKDPISLAVTSVWVTSATVSWNGDNNPADTSYVVEADSDSLFTGNLLRGATVVGGGAMSYTFQAGDLLANTSHWFRIRSVDRLGIPNSNLNFPGIHVTSAAVPINGWFTANDDSSVSIRWGVNSNPFSGTDYLLQIDDNGGFSSPSNATVAADSDPETYTFPSLTPNTSYYVRLQARNRKNMLTRYYNLENDSLNAIPRVTSATVPSANSVGPIWVTSATVNWTGGANPADTQYIVEVDTENFVGNLLAGTTVTGAGSYTFPEGDLLPNTSHWFRIRARNRSGIPTANVSFAGIHVTSAATPTNGSVSGTFLSTATVQWNRNGNPQGTAFIFEVSLDNFATFTAQTTTFTPTGSPIATHTVTGLSQNTTYYYRVRAKNRVGIQTPNLVVGSSVTRVATPFGGEVVAGSVAVSSCAVQWNTNNNPLNVTKYILEVSSETSGNFLFISYAATVTATMEPATHTFTSLVPNTSHYFRVRAVNHQGIPSDNFDAFVNAPALTWARKPTSDNIVALFVSSGTLQWNQADNPLASTDYVLEASSISNTGAWVSSLTVTGPITPTVTVNMTNLSPDTSYYFRVRARNKAGIPTENLVFGENPQVTWAAKPAGAHIDGLYLSTASLSWNINGNAAGQTRYNVQMFTDVGFTNQIGSSTMTPTGLVTATHTMTGVLPNRAHYFRVRAMNRLNVLTDFLNFDNNGLTSFAAVPENGAVTTSGITSAGLRWGPHGNPDNTDYIIEATTEPTGNFSAFTTVISPPQALSGDPVNFTLSGLVPNRLTWFRVRARNRDGILTDYAPIGSTVTWAMVPTFVILDGDVTTIDPTTVGLQWYQGTPAITNPVGTQYIVEASSDPTGGPTGNFGFITRSSTFTPSGVEVATTVLTGLTPGVTSYFRVRAKNSDGVQSANHFIGGSMPPPAAPNGGQYLWVQVSSAGVRWNHNGNPVGMQYQVAAWDAVTNSTVSIYVTPLTPDPATATVTGLPSNRALRFSVRARNGVGTYSSWHQFATTTATLAAQPISGTVDQVGISTVAVSWSGNNNPVFSPSIDPGTQYVLESSTDNTGNFGFFSAVTLKPDIEPATHVVSGLLPNTSTYFRVRARNIDGNLTANETFGPVITLATAPVSGYVDLQNEVYVTSATVHWNQNTNPVDRTAYVLEISTYANFAYIPPAFTHDVPVAGTQIVDYTVPSGLLPNTTHYFRVAAVNMDGIHSASHTFSTGYLTRAATPTAGAIDFIYVSSASIRWSPNGNPNNTAYIIEATTEPSGNFNAFVTTTSTQSLAGNPVLATVTGLLPNRNTYFRVRAKNKAGLVTEYHPFSSPRVTLANPPINPALTMVGTSSMSFTWNENGNASNTEYFLEIDDNEGFSSPASQGWTDFSVPTHTFTGLIGNTTYYIRAKARNTDLFETEFCPTLVSAALANVPTGVVPPFEDVFITSATALWGANGNAAGTLYLVEASSGPDYDFSRYITASATVAATSAQLTSLFANTAHRFRVSAINQSGWHSAFYTIGTTNTLAAVPSITEFTGMTPFDLTLNWNPNGNKLGTEYQAERSGENDPGFATTVLAPRTSATSSAFSGLQVNTTYYFRVRAFNADNVPTVDSVVVGTMTLANAITNGAISDVHATSTTFSWSDPLNPDGRTFYRVDVSTRSDFTPIWTSSTVVDEQLWATAYSPALQSNTTHYARATALNGRGGPSAAFYFNEGQGYATDPLPPTNAFIQSGGMVSTGSFIVSWTDLNPPESLTRFTTEVDTAPDFALPLAAMVTTTGTVKTITNLLANTTYFTRLRAVGHSGVPSDYFTIPGSTVTKANPPTFPYFTNIGASSFTVTWSANGNGSGTRYAVTVDDNSGVPAPSPAASSTTYNTTVTFNGLVNNMLYYINIRTIPNAEWGQSEASLTVSSYVSTMANIPGPADPPITSVGTNHVTVQWADGGNSPTTEYVVETSMDPNFIPLVKSTNVVALSYNFDTLTPNTTYHFRVAAVSNGVTRTQDLIIGTTVTLAAPPVIGAFGRTPTALTVNWTSLNPAGTIFVASNTTTGMHSGTILTNAWTSTSLSTNTAYSFSVKAVNYAGVDAGPVAAGPVFTAAETPSAINVLAFSSTSISMWVPPDTNPASTQFAVMIEDLRAPGDGGDGVRWLGNPVAGDVPAVGGPVWHTYAEWGGLAGVRIVGLEYNLPGYRISVKARNGDNIETPYGPAVTKNTVSGKPVIVLAGHASGDWINTAIVPFEAKDAFHNHFRFTRGIAAPATASDPGWSGSIQPGNPYHDEYDDVNWRGPVAGFRANRSGRWYLRVYGDAYDGLFVPNHTTNPEQSDPFMVLIDTTAPVVDIHAKYGETDATPILDGKGTGRRTPYFYWDNPEPTSNETAGISAIIGFSVSFSTDPSITPATTVDPSISLTTPVKVYGRSDVPVSGTYYFKVRAFDLAGNWTEPARQFAFVFEADIKPPEINRINAGPNIILPQNEVGLAVGHKGQIAVEFNEDMNETSLRAPGSMILRAVRNNMGETISQDVPIEIVYDTTTRTAVVSASTQLPAGYRYILRTTQGAMDLGDNPLAEPVDKIFYTLMNPAQSNVMLSEDGTTRLYAAPGAWGNRWVTPAVNQDPELTPMAAAPSVLRNLIQNANAVARRANGGFAVPLNLDELNLYDGEGDRSPGRFGAEVRLTMAYPDADNDGIIDGSNPPIREEALVLSWLEEETGVWVRVPGSIVDRVNNTVTAPISHFSVYGIIGAPAMDLSNAYAYPVPFKPSLGHDKIRFINLSSLATIKIFTVNGELVRELHETDADGILDWDVTNSEGEPLASDVFIYLIENDQQKKTGKLIIVR